MKCSKCSAYIPDGLNIKNCLECDAPVSQPAAIIPEVKVIKSPEPEFAPRNPILTGDTKEAEFPKFKKLTIGFYIVYSLSYLVQNNSEMRMDPAVGGIIYGPLIILLKVASFIVFIFLIKTMFAIANVLYQRKIVSVPPIAVTAGQVILTVLHAYILGPILPIYFLRLEKRTSAPKSESAPLRSMESCIQCGRPSDPGFKQCVSCRSAAKLQLSSAHPRILKFSLPLLILSVMYFLFIWVSTNDLFNSSSVLLLPEYRNDIKQQWHQVALMGYLSLLTLTSPFLVFYLFKQKKSEAIVCILLVLVLSGFHFFGPPAALWFHHMNGRI